MINIDKRLLKELKARLSSKPYKKQQMAGARIMGRALALLVHCRLTELTAEQQSDRLKHLESVVHDWRLILDAETVDAICCAECLNVIKTHGRSAHSLEQILAGRTVH